MRVLMLALFLAIAATASVVPWSGAMAWGIAIDPDGAP